jgi:UTP--glucose-1-phosphate uridylyltransferase
MPAIKPVRKCVFPVGGLGTRFLPATKAMPKEMLPVVDKPIIQYAVEEARAAGIEEIIFVTGRGKQAIENHFDQSAELDQILLEKGNEDLVKQLQDIAGLPGAVAYVRQQNPQGLGHAVWCARHLVRDEPFAVILADDLVEAKTPCLKQMVDAYNKVGGNMVAAMEVAQEETKRYGIISPGAQNGRMVDIKGLVEKPKPEAAPSRLAVIGRYIIQPVVFDILNAQERGAGGEIQLTDALAKMIGIMPFHGYHFEGRRFDCGDKAGFVAATIAFALARDDLKGPVSAFLKTELA